MRILTLFFFIFCISVNSENLEQKNKLNSLFDQLQKVNNSKTATLLERQIWSIWHEHPDNINLTEKLELGTKLMEYGDYDFALKVFNNVLNAVCLTTPSKTSIKAKSII